MSRDSEFELLQADVRHRRERLALARARLYRGLGSNARLQALERELERAEQHLQHERLRPGR